MSSAWSGVCRQASRCSATKDHLRVQDTGPETIKCISIACKVIVLSTNPPEKKLKQSITFGNRQHQTTGTSAIKTHSLFEVGDEVIPILFLLQTGEGHFCSRDILLGVLEVLKQSLLTPCNALVHIGSGVRKTLGLTGLAAKDARRHIRECQGVYETGRNSPMEVGSNLVRLTGSEGVALSATSLEEASALSRITWNAWQRVSSNQSKPQRGQVRTKRTRSERHVYRV